jgi:sortase A
MSLDIPIVEARVIDGFWELSETTASHGVGSANPGELGNTVIFAHARDELFGPLRNLRQDAFVYVLSKDRWFRYQVIETKLVDPNAVEVIAPTEDEILTLYTCSGFFDTKRLIVVAKPLRP